MNVDGTVSEVMSDKNVIVTSVKAALNNDQTMVSDDSNEAISKQESTTDSEKDQSQFEAYSCARCRKLKKRCPKQTPNCNNCVSVGVPCNYPGRAPRRSKKELEAARLRGEYEPSKRRKKDVNDINTGNSGNTSASNASTNSNTSPVLAFTPTSMPDALSDVGARNLTNVPDNNMEGVSSLISALNSSFDPSTHFKTPPAFPSLVSTNNVSNNMNTNLVLDSQTPSIFSSFPQPLTTNEHKNMHNNEANNNIIPGLTQPIVPPSYQTVPMLITNSNVKSVDKPKTNVRSSFNMEMFDSVPIIDSAIQLETISSVFKGGKETPWVKEDNSYREIDRSLYDRFIAAYFNHNHRTFPMVDKTGFLNRVSTIRDFTQMDGQYNDEFIFKLYMIMAIGCTTLQRAGMLFKDQEELSEHFAYIAMKKFSIVISLQNIGTVKSLLLLGIYSFFEPKGVSSWTISGLLMRLAISLGLNRALPQKKLRTMTATDVELRNRTFWSAYCFERLVATSLGRISAIDDDEINVPLPRSLYKEEESDLEVTLMTITLRRLSGRIYKKVHSVSVGKRNLNSDDKQKIINSLRKEIDDVYATQRAKIQKQKTENYSVAYFNSEFIGDNPDMISFHSSDIWLAMRYSQFQIMLYRPSVLIPKPPLESLTILGEFCLKALKFTYTLYKKKMLPLNWITLFRALTICNTMLYCLCQWSVDLIESKKEIQQCVDILQHFGEKWVFATKCAEVFQNISATILDISLSNGQVPNMDKLTRELFGASDEYKEILDENNVDVAWADKFT